MFKSTFKLVSVIALVGLIFLEPTDRRRTIAHVTSHGLRAAAQLLDGLAQRITPAPQSTQPQVTNTVPQLLVAPEAHTASSTQLFPR